MTETVYSVSNIAGVAAGFALAALLLVYLLRYFGLALYPDAPFLKPVRGHIPSYKANSRCRDMILTALLAFFASRLFFIAVGGIAAYLNGDLAGYMRNLAERWRRWDSYHYLGLMENWYVNEGDPRFHIVFYPLYPLMGRFLCLLDVPSLAAGYLVNLVCLPAAGMAMYELVRMDRGRTTARRAVWLMMFCPVGFFFSAPFTESAFILTTLLGVLFARKRKFLWAVIFGALSANCRSLGMATAIPIFWEMLADLRERHGSVSLKGFLVCVLKVLPVSIGLLLYLELNRQVTGNPLQFLTYQSEHWGQRFGSAMGTLKYTLQYAFLYGDAGYRAGTWIPQLAALIIVLLCLCVAWRRQHPGDAAYALVYYYFAAAPTWLLSGIRYMGGMYALYPLLASLSRKKRVFALILSLEIIAGAYMVYQYLCVGCVM